MKVETKLAMAINLLNECEMYFKARNLGAKADALEMTINNTLEMLEND